MNENHEIQRGGSDADRRNEGSRRASELNRKAFAKYSSGDVSGALADWASLAGMPEASPEQRANALLGSGLAKGAAGDATAAVADYTAVAGMTDAPARQKAMALVSRGAAKANAGDVAAAVEDFTAVLQMEGASADQRAAALLNRAFAKAQSGDAPGAIDDYTSFLMAGCPPGDKAKALINRGNLKRAMGDCAGAVEDYAVVVEMPEAPGEEKVKALVNRGMARREIGDVAGAISDCSAVVESPGAPAEEKARALYGRGLARGKRRDISGEIADYTAILEMADAPADQKAQALFNRAIAKGDSGDTPGAIADYTSILQATSAPTEQKAKALVNRGGAKLQTGDMGGAIDDYSAAIGMAAAAGEQKAMALVNRGSAKAQQGDVGGAIEDYSAVVGMADAPAEQKAKALLGRGLAKGMSGDILGEIAGYTAVLEMSDAPADLRANALFNRALAKGGAGDIPGSITDFTTLLGFPELSDRHRFAARTARALALEREGKFTDALQDCQSAAELAAEKGLQDYQAGAKAFTGLILSSRGEVEDSNEAFVEARKLSPLNVVVDRLRLEAVLRTFSKRDIEEYKSSIRMRQERVTDFIAPCSNFDPGQSVLLLLREWNSYTPAVPAADEDYRGGGYFLWHLGQGIVIDPGYDFMENFFRAHGRVHDIHHVVVSHSHNDHTADLESILPLIHEYNHRPSKPGKQIRLYLSQDAYRKYAGLLDLWRPSISEAIVLNRGNPDKPQAVDLYKGATLTVLRAYHDDELTQGCAVGLGLKLQTVAGVRRLVFTCDTGAYPSGGSRGREREGSAVWKQYPCEFASKPDLLVAHIGSIHEKECDLLQAVLGKRTPDKIIGEESPAFYPNHLGLLGTFRIIDALQPGCAIISEFGEELKDIRVKLVQKMATAFKRSVAGQEGDIPVLCGDPVLVYRIDDNQVLCHETCTFESPQGVETEAARCNGGQEMIRPYLGKKGRDRQAADVQGWISEFDRRRESCQLPYLRPDWQSSAALVKGLALAPHVGTILENEPQKEEAVAAAHHAHEPSWVVLDPQYSTGLATAEGLAESRRTSGRAMRWRVATDSALAGPEIVAANAKGSSLSRGRNTVCLGRCMGGSLRQPRN